MSKKSNNKKVNNVDLEATNSYDIVIDEERLTDKDTLDVSFLDDKKKDASKVSLLDVDYVEKNKDVDIVKHKKNDGFLTIIIILFSFLLGFLLCYKLINNRIISAGYDSIKTIKEVKTKTIVDDNYVFLGDSIFEGYDLEKFYGDLPVINSGISGNKTVDILDNMEERLYRYNPSKVFIMIGTNDIYYGVSSEEIVQNIGKIVDGIKENRKYAEIYVQSIYPINKTDDPKINHEVVSKRTNGLIKGINDSIKKMCQEKKVNYMDIYNVLVDDTDNLKLDYTKEGLHITDAGYSVITKEVMKVIEKDKDNSK